MRTRSVRLLAITCVVAVLVRPVPSHAAFEWLKDAVDGAVGVVDSVFSGLGALPGIVWAAGVLYISGPVGLVPALVEGKAVNELTNGLIKSRHPTDAEYAFAQRVFHDTLPAKDRIILTNMTGLEGRAFVTVDKFIAGNYMMNVGKAFSDPMSYKEEAGSYKAPGQLFVHEMTHVWQLHQASFQPAQVFNGIYTQVVDAELRKVRVYDYTCGMNWDSSYNPEQQAHIVDYWFNKGTACEYSYVVENIRKERFTPRQSQNGGTMASVSRVPKKIDTWWIDAAGAVHTAQWDDTGTSWSQTVMYGAGSAAPGGSIAAASREPTALEIWWIGADGSVQGAYWNEGAKWTRYVLAPAGSAATNSPITGVSRLRGAMEVWWVGANGSVQGAWWYQGPNWTRYELAPPGTAAPAGGIASVSRIPSSMEVWWTGANGSIQGAAWYEGGNWGRYDLAPPGSAALGAGIAAVSRMPTAMELWWVGADGAVRANYWYDQQPWRNYVLAPAGSAARTTRLAAVSRLKNSMEVWWASTEGNLEDAYWFEGGSWQRFRVTAGDAAQAGGLTAVSRLPSKMDVWTSGRVNHTDGAWHTQTRGHFWNEGSPWDAYDLAFESGPSLLPPPGGGAKVVSRDYVYGVTPDGQMLWNAHVTVEKTGPSLADRLSVTGTSVQTAARSKTAQAREPGSPVRMSASAISSVSSARAGIGASSTSAAVSALDKARNTPALVVPPQPVYAHQWEGPKTVAAGWQDFVDIVPASFSTFYALAADGTLKWYRHDGFADGTPRWKGPVNVGTGWNTFTRIVAGASGVVYGIGSDGSLRWYRESDADDASNTPRWLGPQVVSSGWKDFVHVFSTGEGVLYAVDQQGRLWWYRHVGYFNGSSEWQGPRQVGTGWADMKHIFSSGEGVIYAVNQAGELLLYEHLGYKDGTTAFRGPTTLAQGWGNYVRVFPAMHGPPPVLH